MRIGLITELHFICNLTKNVPPVYTFRKQLIVLIVEQDNNQILFRIDVNVLFVESDSHEIAVFFESDMPRIIVIPTTTFRCVALDALGKPLLTDELGSIPRSLIDE